jgi:hypothetical protein
MAACDDSVTEWCRITARTGGLNSGPRAARLRQSSNIVNAGRPTGAPLSAKYANALAC